MGTNVLEKNIASVFRLAPETSRLHSDIPRRPHFDLFSIGSFLIDQKQLENVECFKYLGSVLTNDGRCTCEIKSRIAVAKAAFSKKKTLFTSKLDLNSRKKLVKCYSWSMALYGAEIPGKF